MIFQFDSPWPCLIRNCLEFIVDYSSELGMSQQKRFFLVIGGLVLLIFGITGGAKVQRGGSFFELVKGLLDGAVKRNARVALSLLPPAIFPLMA